MGLKKELEVDFFKENYQPQPTHMQKFLGLGASALKLGVLIAGASVLVSIYSIFRTTDTTINMYQVEAKATKLASSNFLNAIESRDIGKAEQYYYELKYSHTEDGNVILSKDMVVFAQQKWNDKKTSDKLIKDFVSNPFLGINEDFKKGEIFLHSCEGIQDFACRALFNLVRPEAEAESAKNRNVIKDNVRAIEELETL